MRQIFAIFSAFALGAFLIGLMPMHQMPGWMMVIIQVVFWSFFIAWPFERFVRTSPLIKKNRRKN